MWNHFSSIYGEVSGFRIGRCNLVVVSGIPAIKEFYSNEEFSGRPNGFFYKIRTFNKPLGIVFTDGKDWDIQRKFTMKVMRRISNIKATSNIGNHIQIETQEMVNFFRRAAMSNTLIDMEHIFDIPVLNNVWALLSGYRFHLEDKRLHTLLKLVHESFRILDMSGGLLNEFPFIRYIAPEKCGYKRLVETVQPIWDLLKECIEDIKSKPESESIIKEFLKQIDEGTPAFTMEHLLAICLDFFQAGSETTSNTLGFGLIYLMHSPRVLCKLRQEIDEVLGNRVPTLQDRSNLKYVEAVINEVQRIANVAPLAIAHRCFKTTNFRGHVIPRDTIMLVSTYSLNMDEEYWKDPFNFRPERFLDDNGEIIYHEPFMPFGAGKRRCIGETIARSNLFLFFTAFIQRFDIELPLGSSLPELVGLDGLTLSPQPFKAYIRIRERLISDL